MRKPVLVILIVLAVVACAEESPERAIYALAHDLEHEGTAGACERVYPSRELPGQVATALSLRTGAAGRRGPAFDCSGAFGSEGQLRSLHLEEPRVRSVAEVEVEPTAGITAAATAQVAISGAEPVTVKLVEFEGTWRVLVDLDSGRLAQQSRYGRARVSQSRPPSVDRRTEPSSRLQDRDRPRLATGDRAVRGPPCAAPDALATARRRRCARR